VTPRSAADAHGIGGVGKTRASPGAAHDAENGSQIGVLFVALASLSDPTLVVSTIARVAGA
jgi:predicted ATPase